MAATVVDITGRLAHTSRQREEFNQTITELDELTEGKGLAFVCKSLGVSRVDEISMAAVTKNLRGLRNVVKIFRRSGRNGAGSQNAR